MTSAHQLRQVIKERAPRTAVAAVKYRREVWSDLRLRMLTEVGHLPSHTVRDAVYRRAGLELDPTSSIHWRAEFYRPEGIVISANTIIGDSVFLDGRDGIAIGRSVNIGSHVSVYTRQHDIDSPTFAETGGPVVIDDYAYIASHSIVLPGVCIGYGAVVAAGSVVTKDVEPYALVAGVPAVFKRYRNRDLTYQLNYAKRFV